MTTEGTFFDRQDHQRTHKINVDATCTQVCTTNADLYIAEHLRMEGLRNQGVDLSNKIPPAGKRILDARQNFEQLRLW